MVRHGVRLGWSLVAVLLIAGSGSAQVVVPSASALVEGAGGLSTPTNSAARTLQVIISASELASIGVGSEISGLAFRLDASQGSQPVLPISFASYDIYLGAAGVSPLGAAATFSDNYLSPASKTQVRGGALSLGSGFFPNTGGVPNAFSADIAFNLGNYLYTGGNLIVELSHTGNGAQDFALDAVVNSGSVAAYGAVGYNALANGNVNSVGAPPTLLAPVLRLTATAPEPGVLGLLGLGALVLCVRRRR